MDFSLNNSRNENLLNSSFKKKKEEKRIDFETRYSNSMFLRIQKLKSIPNSNNSTVLEKRIKTVLLFFDKWDS